MTEQTIAEHSLCPTAPSRLTFVVPVLLLLSSAAALVIDIPVASFFKHSRCPSWLTELLDNAETFGHGVGASLIVIAIWVLDPRRRSRIGWLCAGSLGAGMVANVTKLSVARSRPRNFDLLQGTVWDSFGSWFPGKLSNAVQSFPSAHTATAVGLALMLAAWYPRGRWYFAALAMLVGLQRLQCSAHYPSDVLAGAALGWLVAASCLAIEPLGIKQGNNSEMQ